MPVGQRPQRPGQQYRASRARQCVGRDRQAHHQAAVGGRRDPDRQPRHPDGARPVADRRHRECGQQATQHRIAEHRSESHAKLGGWHDYPFVAEAAAEANELARPSGRFLVRRGWLAVIAATHAGGLAGDSAAPGNARIFGVAVPARRPDATNQQQGPARRCPCRAGAARSGRRALAADATDRPRC